MGYLDGSGHVNKIFSLQRENDIITMLLEGKERKEIILFVCNKYRVSKSSANLYIYHAQKIIKERRNYEFNTLVSLHIARYEYIYEKLYAIGAWFGSMKALKAKEVLLGFHRAGFHMKVTQGEIQEVSQTHASAEYDINKLPIEKRTRMMDLLDKARSLNKKLEQHGHDGGQEAIR